MAGARARNGGKEGEGSWLGEEGGVEGGEQAEGASETGRMCGCELGREEGRGGGGHTGLASSSPARVGWTPTCRCLCISVGVPVSTRDKKWEEA